ncbi:MAG: hypothetical protein IJV40_03575 [Oscillospiraceae bacterium]|nr:hypothetical protein [Oscillospiraceae bacterium]
MPLFNNNRRMTVRDGALPPEDNTVGFSAGDVAVAQSLYMRDNQQAEPFQRLPVDKAEIRDAYQTLLKYREGKASLERRLIENQQWYKLRQWEYLRRKQAERGHKEQIEPSSAWLLNSIANKHADAMDNFPAANILPREEGDKQEAKNLSSVLPVVLDQCNFEATYSDVQDDKIGSGTGVYGIFWDPSKHNGLGDIDISCVDLINLFWESGITDIQESRNVFYVTLQDNDILIQDYPELEHKLSNPVMDLTKYIYDDTVDTNNKSAVVDWYYKKRGANGKTLLHYCKFVAGQESALFATENDPEYTERGWYDHGLYPFVFDPLMRCKGTPTGFGFIDIGKSAQEYIDRGDQAILQNMLFNARPRHFIRNDGSVNEKEFADATSDFIHVDGNLGTDSILPVQANPLNQLYVQILANKVTELKETTGNRDVSTGGTTSGVTAASAIAAMQEAGSKLSRDNNKGSYRAFRKVVLMCIELVRQFYDIPRWFRILGEQGREEFIQYSNAGILPQPQGQMVNGVPMELGVEVGYRLPLFDIEVTAEKQSPYSKMAQNELALQFYSAGFFAPQNADAALACLDMMDFDRKDFVMQKIQVNGTLMQMLVQTQQIALQLAQTLDAEHGTALAQNMAAQFGMEAQAMPGQPMPAGGVSQLEALGGEGEGLESSITKNARQRVAQSTAPR